MSESWRYYKVLERCCASYDKYFFFFPHRALEGALIIHVFNVSHESCHEIMSGINHRYTQLSLSALWKQSSFWAEHFSELSQAQKSLLRRQRPDI